MPIDNKYGRVTLENQRNIGDDEPVVVFRAQGELLPDVMAFYYGRCHGAGSPQRHLDLILDSRDKILKWQAEHPTKVPTSDPLVP